MNMTMNKSESKVLPSRIASVPEWQRVRQASEVKRARRREIDLIVVHCSATRCTQEYPPSALVLAHKQRGFVTAGYHFYITQDGALYALRPVEMEGAHARGYNRHSIGVCYEGGLDRYGKPTDTRTSEQRQMLSQLISVLRVQYPCAVVVGQRSESRQKW